MGISPCRRRVVFSQSLFARISVQSNQHWSGYPLVACITSLAGNFSCHANPPFETGRIQLCLPAQARKRGSHSPRNFCFDCCSTHGFNGYWSHLSCTCAIHTLSKLDRTGCTGYLFPGGIKRRFWNFDAYLIYCAEIFHYNWSNRIFYSSKSS